MVTVSFDMQGHGSDIAPQTIATGSKADKPTDPTADGYVFKGWYKEATCENEWNFDSDTVSTNTTLYAKWQVTVTFDVQGHGTAPATQTLDINGKADKPTDPTADGYVFKGWYKEAACTNEWNFDSDQAATNTTLYAKWQVTVTFDVQGHGTAPATQTLDINGKADKPTDPTADGYVFKGWYKEAACTNEWNFDSDQAATNTTLYAKWQVTVTFDVQGHGTAPATQTLDINGKADKPTDPTADGYVFKGWYKEAACTNEWNFDSDTVSTNTTLYAKWQVTVTFDVQGKGTAPDSQTIMDGSKVSKPIDPTYEGYVLEGWYKEATCENEWNFDSDTVSSDKTLYAKWITALSDKILKAKKIYTDGESACLSDSANSVISINGIDCYVLKVDGDKAELITKDIYDVRFNGNGKKGENDYNYSESDLKIWMDDFYTNNLKSGHDSESGDENAILETTVTYYYSDDVNATNLATCNTGTISQKVFALDAQEGKANSSKFSWSGGSSGFWLAAGCKYPRAFTIMSNGTFSRTWTTNTAYGARPAFWISLD